MTRLAPGRARRTVLPYPIPGTIVGVPRAFPGRPGLFRGPPALFPGAPGLVRGGPALFPGAPGVFPGRPALFPGSTAVDRSGALTGPTVAS